MFVKELVLKKIIRTEGRPVLTDLCDRALHSMRVEAHAGGPEIPLNIQHDTCPSLFMLALALKILHHADDPAARSVGFENMPDSRMGVRKVQGLDKRLIDHHAQDAVYPLSPGDRIPRQHVQPEHPDIMFVYKFYLGDIFSLDAPIGIVEAG